MNNLNEIATADLVGSESFEDMAAREGWTADVYTLGLAEQIRNSIAPLDYSRERLQALVCIGAKADKAAAEELGRHYLILEALMHRFSAESVSTLVRGGHGSTERADRLLSASLKAQRAGMAVLSALKVLRDAPGAPAKCPAEC